MENINQSQQYVQVKNNYDEKNNPSDSLDSIANYSVDKANISGLHMNDPFAIVFPRADYSQFYMGNLILEYNITSFPEQIKFTSHCSSSIELGLSPVQPNLFVS